MSWCARRRGGGVVGALVCWAVLAPHPHPTAAADEVVRRIAGDDRAATAAAFALDGWAGPDAAPSPTAVVADGRDPAVALVAAHLAARLDAPLLLGGPDLPPATVDALDVLGPDRLLVVGDVDVPGQADGTSAGGATTVERIVGGDAPALAAEALDRVPAETGRPVLLAAAGDAPDALAAAALAPAALLLTSPDALDPATAGAIRRLDPAEVVLLGGPSALSPDVEADVAGLGAATRRIAGTTRYETAVAVALDPVAGERPTAVVAAGERFADAVAAVPWAARRSAAVLLTPHDELPQPTRDHLGTRRPTAAVIAGGTVAVGGWVDRQLVAVLTGTPEPPAVTATRPLTEAERDAMTPAAWRPGCPVGLDDLRVLELLRWVPGGDVADDGVLVVHADVAEAVAGALQALFDARFPIDRADPVEVFGGDDQASMAAGNTSAFNCRTVAGTTTWSQHAYGRAIDLNPIQNPYVRGDDVQPEAGRAYLDRTDVRPGMVVRPGPVLDAFQAIGWGWGGDFTSSRDYQHLSATGR